MTVVIGHLSVANGALPTRRSTEEERLIECVTATHSAIDSLQVSTRPSSVVSMPLPVFAP